MNKLNLLVATTLLCLSTSTLATNKALLIGVGNYQDADKLEGPEHDVSALKKTLQKYWGFKAQNIKTLINYDATRENILKALTSLKDGAKAGDQIFIYFSGHGTSDFDKQLGIPLPYSGTGAQVPYGFKKGATTNKQIIDNLLVGKRDLRPIFSALDKTNAQVFMIFDSCYSGSANRGIGNLLPTRTSQIFNIEEEEVDCFNCGTQKVDPYPYVNIVFFSASSSREKATDIPKNLLTQYPTIDGKPHGAFTDALLRGMSGELNTDQNKNGQTNYNELLSGIKAFMKERGYPHEPFISPAINEDKGLLSHNNVLGQKKSPFSPPTLLPSILSVNITPTSPELANVLKQEPEITISSTKADLNLIKQGSHYQIRNKAGDLITTLVSPDIKDVVDRIKQEGWKKHFKQQLEQNASINIAMSLNDGVTGSTAMLGDKVAFGLRSETPIYLVLLDIQSDASISILYPFKATELKQIPANKMTFIPSEDKSKWIEVREPAGIDHVVAIGFSKPPLFLKEFLTANQGKLQPGTDLYKKFMQHIKTAKLGYAELDLLTVPKH